MKLRRSYRKTTLEKHGSNVRWEAVLKDGSGKVFWACGHAHRRRDFDRSGDSAAQCADRERSRRFRCEAA